VKVVPFEEQWANSPHNDAEAVAFNYWNESEAKQIPVTCATCHSTPGYLDYLGEDGSAFGVVDAAVDAPAGTIQCVACHAPTAVSLTEVTFPYVGKDADGNAVPTVLSGLGDSTRCAVCHQGRASMSQVDDAIARYGLTDDVDKVSEPQGDPARPLGFINIHYYAAAATLYGTEAKAGYEYAGQTYDARFAHVEGYDTCASCHNPHTLELEVEQCSVCHSGVASVDDVRNIRMLSSAVDFDGDGNINEPIKAEIEGLQELLYSAIQAYATEKAGADIVYNPDRHPYFFNAEEVAYPNWTARLLKAAYNYQVSKKDPGAYAHNAKYIIQLLHDSIADLNEVLASPVDLSKAARNDHSHFAGSKTAFRYWDKQGEVPAACAKCHTSTGLPTFLKNNANIAAEPTNGFQCTTCHNEAEWPALYPVASVRLPSGKTVTFGEEAKDNICMHCHSGRESKISVDTAIRNAGVGDDEASPSLSFRNIHYFAAAVSLFGAEAQGAYEFNGQEYVGKFAHVPGFDTCLGCHDAHTQEVKVETCFTCHAAAGGDLAKIRMGDPVDYDGDGDTTEGIVGEIETMRELLYAALQAYGEDKGTPIVYNAARYPYFFDNEGKGFASWTPSLLRAAYNYQVALKDPGGFAHNAKYILQLLYDSIASIGGDVSTLTRP
jgi:hypothetical protein